MKSAGCVKTKQKQIFNVVVMSGNERIGSMSPRQFMSFVRASSETFLETAVERFNTYKKEIDEPERVLLEVIS